MEWESQVRSFIVAANRAGVEMIMVGGAAVNWYGYKRHSADIDFCIDRSPVNLRRLVTALSTIGLEVERFPAVVEQGLQNISLKFSPADLDVELITRFSVDKTFEVAYADSELVAGADPEGHYWRVISYPDLVTSKVKSARPKDLLDIQELQRIRGPNR